MSNAASNRPPFDLERAVLDIRAEMTALELAFEAIIPESDAAEILRVSRCPGFQIGLIQTDGRRALMRILFHLRNEIEDLTTGTIGRVS